MLMCLLRQDWSRCSVTNWVGTEEKLEKVGLEVYLGAPLALEAGGSGDGAVASAEQSTEALDLVLGVDVDAEVGGRGGGASGA